MARVTFGGGGGAAVRSAPVKPIMGRRPPKEKVEKRWYEDPGMMLAWVKLAESLAAPKGLVARGVRAAQRWSLTSDAEERAEAAREAEEIGAAVESATAPEAYPLQGWGDNIKPPAVDEPFIGLASNENYTGLPRPQSSSPLAQRPASGSIPTGATGVINQVERSGASPDELKEQFGQAYVDVLLRRVESGKNLGSAEQDLQALGVSTGKEAAPATKTRERVSYRQSRDEAEETSAARAAEVSDYTARRGLSTVQGVYEDFAKYSQTKGGPLDSGDFADFWEQVRSVQELDPALVEGLSLDALNTKRALLSDSMAYFKFLNMGGDPAAARRATKKETKMDLTIAKMQRDAAEAKAKADKVLTRKGYKPAPGVPDDWFDWKDDLNAWANNKAYPDKYGDNTVKSYLKGAGGRQGSAANAVRLEVERRLKVAWGDKKGWRRKQKETLKGLTKAIESHLNVTNKKEIAENTLPKTKITSQERAYDSAKSAYSAASAKRDEVKRNLAAMPKGSLGKEKEKHGELTGSLAKLELEVAGKEAVMMSRAGDLKVVNPAYFGTSGDGVTTNVLPGHTVEQ